VNLYVSTFISHSGYCSRRKAIELVKSGHVCINDSIVTDPTTKVTENDVVTIDGEVIEPEKYVYILFNKPTGCITTTSDEKGRTTVLDYVKTKERLFPVGRLDQDTTGLLLLTNDGDLAQQLMHPRFQVEKEYHVTLDKPLEKIDLQKIKKGVTLPDGFLKPDSLTSLKNNDCSHLSIIIHSGKKRIIRRLFAHFDYQVIHLDRVRYAIFSKEELAIGTYRQITKDELQKLQTYINERKSIKN